MAAGAMAGSRRLRSSYFCPTAIGHVGLATARRGCSRSRYRLFGDWIAGVATDGFGGFVSSVFAAIAYMIAVSAAVFVSYKAMMLSLANIDETAEKWNAALVT